MENPSIYRQNQSELYRKGIENQQLYEVMR
jgi:hypothetical protein